MKYAVVHEHYFLEGNSREYLKYLDLPLLGYDLRIFSVPSVVYSYKYSKADTIICHLESCNLYLVMLYT